TPTPIDEITMGTLSRSVEREGGRLRVISDPASLLACSEMQAKSDRLRFLVPSVHASMLAELRWPGRDPLEEGLDVRTLEMDAAGFAAMGLVSRPDVMAHLADWRAGSALGLRAKAAILTSSAVVLVTVPRPDSSWYVRGGAAMEGFWLTAEAEGLAVQPAAPLFIYAIDDADLRALVGDRYLDETHGLQSQFREFWGLEGAEAPVMLMRVLHAPPASVHSIRKPLGEVLTRNGSSPHTPPISAQNM
ncbi:MAG TPA: hypothetical protein VGS21_01605, partial [Acidimicrobiales bacterium]|nr:hypothetical protein [Acidimicrobiales bacterium]